MALQIGLFIYSALIRVIYAFGLRLYLSRPFSRHLRNMNRPLPRRNHRGAMGELKDGLLRVHRLLRAPACHMARNLSRGENYPGSQIFYVITLSSSRGVYFHIKCRLGRRNAKRGARVNERLAVLFLVLCHLRCQLWFIVQLRRGGGGG